MENNEFILLKGPIDEGLKQKLNQKGVNLSKRLKIR